MQPLDGSVDRLVGTEGEGTVTAGGVDGHHPRLGDRPQDLDGEGAEPADADHHRG